MSPSAPAEAMGPIERAVRAVQAGARRVLVWQSIVLICSLALLTLLALGTLDFVIRAPGWMRIVILAGFVGGVAWLSFRWVRPAMRFAPPLSSIALRVEKRRASIERGLNLKLASSLELVAAAKTDAFARRAVEDARKRFDAAVTRDIVRTVHLRRRTGALLLVISGLVGLSVWQPGLVMTGAARVLAPWTDAAWPKRTAIVNATTTTVHPSGETLPVRAILSRSPGPASQTDVRLRYRLTRDGRTGPTRSALLTSQERRMRSPDDQAEGMLFERLLEPFEFEGESAELEYWIETSDDRTDTARITLVTPPSVLDMNAQVVLPEYAGAIEQEQGWTAGSLALGAGSDDRAIVGPVLAGSTVTVRATLSKEVPGPNGEDPEWLEQTLGSGFADLERLRATLDGTSLEIEWAATRATRLEIHPRDSFGLRSLESAVLVFDVIEDADPSIALTQPARDEAVLATAVVALSAEARDDVGLKDVWISRQSARPPEGDSPGALPEASGEEIVVVREQATGSRAVVTTDLDLSPLGLRPGDEIRLRAYAVDLRDELPSESQERVLMIISESDLIERLLADLASVRRAAINTDREQEQLQSLIRSGELNEDAPITQNRITARVGAMLETFDRAQDRLERNGLQDPSLDSLIRDGLEAARRAAAASADAGEALDREAAEDDPETEDILESQQDVREQLERVARLLDQGEDAWAVRRSLESLIADQEQLASATAEVGARTAGRPMNSLTPAELTELDRIAQRQLELAEQAEQVMDELDERADAIAEADEAQAAAMRAAAQRGRQSGVAGQMSQAGQQVRQNQTGEAGENQQDALDALDEMMQSLDDAEGQRREALKRQLASMSQSIQNLIRMQSNEIDALNRGTDAGTLSRGMARLHRATIAVHSEAMSTADLEDAADLLELAADEQNDAAGALRVVPAELESALTSEQASLEKLNEALEEINRLQEEAERDDVRERRRELRRAYTELLELQAVLRGDTQPFDTPRLTRRDRADLRALGRRQSELRDRGDSIRTQTEGLGDAAAFSAAHDRLSELQTAAADRMGDASSIKRALLEQASAVRLLRGLVDALSEDENNEDFEEGSGGGGGGEGSSGPEPLVPPIAELKLLRAMQDEALALTKLAEDSGGEEISSSEVAEIQNELAELGQQLIDQMQETPVETPADAPVPESVEPIEPEGDE